MIDLPKAKKAFAQYVQSYDTKDERIALKIKHTYEVMNYSRMIAEELHLSDEQIQLASLIGLLHDIGRFEQVRRYHTFIDRDSVDHAQLGIEILKEQNRIRLFVEQGYDDIIFDAISNHNRFQIEEGLSQEAFLQASIIRDADKTDILRVNNENSCEVLFMCQEKEMCQTTISDTVKKEFLQHHTILASLRQTPGDVLCSHIALVYDFHYATGLRIIKKQQWIQDMLHRFTFLLPKTRQDIQQIEHEVTRYLDDRLANISK